MPPPRFSFRLCIALALPAGAAAAASPWCVTPDLTVATDGSGNFRTIQAALDSIGANNHERRVILIRDGVYRGKIRVDAADVTLVGESRAGTRIEFAQGAEEFRRHPDPVGIGVVNINGNDCVLANLTVRNTHGVVGVHAFAIYGRGDRTVIEDCDVLSQGNDTLSLWDPDGGRYYHARLRITGSVDFVCPRGWCYMTDCELDEENPHAEAVLWHDGSRNRDMKFVVRDCRFDGVAGWRLARHHHDAQFYLLGCTFSNRMLDVPPRRVVYPLGGRPVTEADRQRNRDLDATNRWGERAYYLDCHREGGDYAWFRDNLARAPGAPAPAEITARWAFDGTWDPEHAAGPAILRVEQDGSHARVVFSEPVTVRGHPALRLGNGTTAAYAGGTGSATLQFVAPDGDAAPAAAFTPGSSGTILACEASATPRWAPLAFPK